jgi:hypothetical protein
MINSIDTLINLHYHTNSYKIYQNYDTRILHDSLQLEALQGVAQLFEI